MSDYQFQPTLSGLNNVSANAIDGDELDITTINCTDLTITGTGVAITQPQDDNSTKIATTEYVDNQVISGNLTGSNNTWTGTNTYNNWVYFNSGTQVDTQIRGDATTKIANTYFVADALTGFQQAPNVYSINDQDFTAVGLLTATQTTGDNTTNAASTAFVQQEFATYNATKQTITYPPIATNDASAWNELIRKIYVDTYFPKFANNNVMTGTNYFENTVRIYDDTAPTLQTGVQLAVANTASVDTTVNGTYNGENVYSQVQFGARPFVIAQGVDNEINYFGTKGSSGDDPDFDYTMKRGVGLKIDPAFGTDTFSDALHIVGDAKITSSLKCNTFAGKSASDNITLFSATTGEIKIGKPTTSGGTADTYIYGDAISLDTFEGILIQADASTIQPKTYASSTGYYSFETNRIVGKNTTIEQNASGGTLVISPDTTTISSATTNLTGATTTISSAATNLTGTTTTISGNLKSPNVSGVFMYTNQGGHYGILPIFYSCEDLTNFTGQANTWGTTDYNAQSGTAVGSWGAINLPNSDHRWLVYPNYGLIVYKDNGANTGYNGDITVNFKNDTSNPKVVRSSNLWTADAIKIYFNDVEITSV